MSSNDVVTRSSGVEFDIRSFVGKNCTALLSYLQTNKWATSRLNRNYVCWCTVATMSVHITARLFLSSNAMLDILQYRQYGMAG